MLEALYLKAFVMGGVRILIEYIYMVLIVKIEGIDFWIMFGLSALVVIISFFNLSETVSVL